MPTKKVQLHQTYSLIMAEKEGFEPSHPVTSLLAFQASPFNHLGISPTVVIIARNYIFVISFCNYDLNKS